jgi:hypothetical protein
MSLEEQFINILRGCDEKGFDKYYEVKNEYLCFVFKGVPFVTPIWYSININLEWRWSPDGVHWMSIDNLIVTGGFWKNCKPARCNIYIIESLRNVDTANVTKYLITKKTPVLQVEDTNNRPECIVCLDKTAIYLAQPCNHLLYCNKCYSNLLISKSKCSICNGNAVFGRIFF